MNSAFKSNLNTRNNMYRKPMQKFQKPIPNKKTFGAVSSNNKPLGIQPNSGTKTEEKKNQTGQRIQNTNENILKAQKNAEKIHQENKIYNQHTKLNKMADDNNINTKFSN